MFAGSISLMESRPGLLVQLNWPNAFEIAFVPQMFLLLILMMGRLGPRMDII